MKKQISWVNQSGYSLLALFCTLFIFSHSLEAEILDVVVRWNAFYCNQNCGRSLEIKFAKIPGVTKVSLNVALGQATLFWKPTTAFSYYPIDWAMRSEGPHINEVRMKIRGKIKFSGKDILVVSSQDETPFILLNTVVPDLTKYVTQQSHFNRYITEETRQQLADGAKKDLYIIVEGPLFEPWRSPPLKMILEKFNFEEKKESRRHH